MGLFTAMATYFIVWWTVLFAVLPFAARGAGVATDYVAGADAGAPAQFPFRRTVITTTLAATVIWGLIVTIIVLRWVEVPRHVWNAS